MAVFEADESAEGKGISSSSFFPQECFQLEAVQGEAGFLKIYSHAHFISVSERWGTNWELEN